MMQQEVIDTFRFVLIGAGQRGMLYARYAYDSGLADIVSVVEPDAARRDVAAKAFGIKPALCFSQAREMFERGRLGDACIIASMDRDHFAQAQGAMDAGYHLLLEKPISPDPRECMALAHAAERLKRKVVVCHVLRYSPFFRAVKALIDGGTLGRVVSIQHNENIGNFHMAHAFVRGNWSRASASSPIIMQKSCHDMDLLVWLTGSRADKLSSFGGLAYFKPENAPKNSAMRCLDCAAALACRFDARKMYLPVAGSWPASVLGSDQSEQGLLKAMRNGPYGRCVYRCGNDVCDHQVVNILFENGVTATFNLSAFTNYMARTMKIMCEDGEIRVNEHERRIEVLRFSSNATQDAGTQVIQPSTPQGGHAGGDAGLMNDFFTMLRGDEAEAETRIARSVESHYMACAAEAARLEGRVVDMAQYRKSLEAAAQ